MTEKHIGIKLAEQLTSLSLIRQLKVGKWARTLLVVLPATLVWVVIAISLTNSLFIRPEQERQELRAAANSVYTESVQRLARELVANSMKTLTSAEIASVDLVEVRQESDEGNQIPFRVTGSAWFRGADGKKVWRKRFMACLDVLKTSSPNKPIVDGYSIYGR